MPSLTAHQSNKITKLLLVGNSGSGKTGALVSLVKAGYKLRVLDFDNGLDSLAALVKSTCPDKLANIEYVTLRDKFKASPMGPVVDGIPTAFVDGLKLLDKWEDGSTPGKLGDQYVVVIDSLTFLSESAFNWATAMNPGAKDKRQIYGAAMDAIENAISLLTSVNFGTNVVMISHIKFIDQPDGTTKGYPTAIGNALSPKIPAYFNHVALCEVVGQKRQLRIQSSGLVDLKSTVAFKLAPTLPIETALADFFAEVRK
jgi:hypothetical protein